MTHEGGRQPMTRRRRRQGMTENKNTHDNVNEDMTTQKQ